MTARARAPGAPRGAARQPYYYADGKPVALREDERHRVVPESVLAELVSDLREHQACLERARRLPGGLLVVELDSLPEKARRALRADPRVQPLFRYGAEMIHVLPEIAVASSNPSQLSAARRLLLSHDAQIDARRDDEFVAHLPASSSLEILEVARRVVEKTHAEMAQPRFLRIAPKARAAP